MLDADAKKKCPRCGEMKIAAGNFYRVNRTDCDGFAGYCIECTKAKVVEWQKSNPEKKAATDAKMYRKHPHRRDRLKKFRKEFAAANPDHLREKSKQWAKANPDKRRASVARHRANNPESVKAAQAKYHASDRFKAIHADRERLRRSIMRAEHYRENGTIATVNSFEFEGKFTVKEWHAVLKAFEHACAYCGSRDRITIEHLTPLSRGGKNVVGNIAPACSPCNTSKNAKTLEEFAPERAAEIRDRAQLH